MPKEQKSLEAKNLLSIFLAFLGTSLFAILSPFHTNLFFVISVSILAASIACKYLQDSVIRVRLQHILIIFSWLYLLTTWYQLATLDEIEGIYLWLYAIIENGRYGIWIFFGAIIIFSIGFIIPLLTLSLATLKSMGYKSEIRRLFLAMVRSKRIKKIILRLGLILLLLTTSVYRTKSISFNGTWSPSNDRSCLNDRQYADALNINIEDENLAKLALKLCTTGASQFLMKQDSEQVTVHFRIHYLFYRVVHYSVVGIGNWQGSTTSRVNTQICVYDSYDGRSGCGENSDVVRSTTNELFRYSRH